MFPSGYVWYSIGGIGIADGLVNSWNGLTGVVTVTTSSLPEGSNLYYTDTRARAGVISSSITNGDTTHAPSGDAVYDALALKQDVGNYITALTSDVSASGPGSVAATVNSVGGSTAANIHSAELLANAATDANTLGTIVKRDGSGNFIAGTGTFTALVSASIAGATGTAINLVNGTWKDSSAVTQFSVSTSGAKFDSLTATTVPYLDASKVLTSSAVTPTELGYVSGVSSAIQTQLNAKQATLTPGSISTSTTGVTVASGASSTVGPNVTINIATASGSQSGLLASADWTTFNNKVGSGSFGNLTEATSSVLTITGGSSSVFGSGTSIQVKVANTSQSGYLTSTDWNTFNGKQAALSLGNLTEATSSVLTITGGSGAVVGSVSIQVKAASTSQAGYLSSTDWNTFNGKQAALTFGSISTSTTGVTVTNGSNSTVGPNVTVNIATAATAQNGILSSTDWNTFNGKQAAYSFADQRILGNVSGSTAAPIALTAAQVNTMLGSLSNPMTTAGDMIYGGASGVATRLANGAVGDSLISNGSTNAPLWAHLTPNVQTLTASSGTYGVSYWFVITSGSATIGATYTNNSKTFTVARTIASETLLLCTSTGAPAASGTLTKSAGTGDSTITFSSAIAPRYLRIIAVGPGGGGSGGGTSGVTGSSGSASTTFNSTTIVCGAGVSGGQGGGGAQGGTTTIAAPAIGYAATGAPTTGIVASPPTQGAQGGMGGSSIFGGGGGGSWSTGTGGAGATNSGSGGGGGGCGSSNLTGQGGSSGGWADVILYNPAATYAYTVGAGGAGGSAGTGGGAGGAGADGKIVIYEFFG